MNNSILLTILAIIATAFIALAVGVMIEPVQQEMSEIIQEDIYGLKVGFDVLLDEDATADISIPALEKDKLTFAQEDEFNVIMSITPSRLTFFGDTCRKAIIDLGESVTYSGDLPVEESAKLFFEAVGHLLRIHGQPTSSQPLTERI